MTLSRGSYRVLRKTRYMVRVENRIVVPHGTRHPNQLVDHVVGHQLRGFTLSQFALFVPTILRVMHPRRTRAQRQKLAHLTRTMAGAALWSMPRGARAFTMRSKPKTDPPGIQVLLSIEKTQPLQRRLRPEPVDGFDLLISMADPLIGRHEVVDLLLKRVDLPVVESALLAPELVSKSLGLARPAGTVVALLALELLAPLRGVSLGGDVRHKAAESAQSLGHRPDRARACRCNDRRIRPGDRHQTRRLCDDARA